MTKYEVTLCTMEEYPFQEFEAETEAEAIKEEEEWAYENYGWHGYSIKNLDTDEERKLM